MTDGTIIEFLQGSHTYEGVAFGEKHPIRQGAFWWRSVLREYLASQQQPAGMRWVKASERLPGYDIPVLWISKDGNQFVEMLDKDGNDWLYEMELSPSKVTHWMPLPAEPTHNNQNQ